MDITTLENYKSNIKLIQRLGFLMLIIQGIVSTFHLFVPSIISNSESLSQLEAVILGIVGLVMIILISARMVDLEGGDKLTKIVRIICIIGIMHQTSLGVNTIYSISFYVIAVIGENILLPKLEIIQRTQNFASHDKLTEEVFQAISHADNYLESQVRWSVNAIILLIITSIISIFMITLFNVLPLLISNIIIIQVISIMSLLILIYLILTRGFPEFNSPPSEIESYQ